MKCSMVDLLDRTHSKLMYMAVRWHTLRKQGVIKCRHEVAPLLPCSVCNMDEFVADTLPLRNELKRLRNDIVPFDQEVFGKTTTTP